MAAAINPVDLMRVAPNEDPSSAIVWEAVRVATEPPYDVAAVIELCLGKAAFAVSLIESFQQDSEAHLARLQKCAAEGNVDAAGDVAHALKGSAGIVSANRVRRIAAEIQAAGEEGRVLETRQLIGSLSQEISSCREYLSVVRAAACSVSPYPGSE